MPGFVEPRAGRELRCATTGGDDRHRPKFAGVLWIPTRADYAGRIASTLAAINAAPRFVQRVSLRMEPEPVIGFKFTYIDSDAVSVKMCPLDLKAAPWLHTQRSHLCVLPISAFSFL